MADDDLIRYYAIIVFKLHEQSETHYLQHYIYLK